MFTVCGTVKKKVEQAVYYSTISPMGMADINIAGKYIRNIQSAVIFFH